MRRRLAEHLPPVLLTTCEFPLLCKAEQIEMDELASAAEGVLCDQFVTTATARGLARYEKIYGIVPQDTDTLDERRFRVLARINAQLPYTVRRLKQLLETLCGEDGYRMALSYGEYLLEVKVALTAKRNLSAVQELLREVVPANMVVSCTLLYNQHRTLARFTHTRLAAYTHRELREEVLDGNENTEL